jgi:disulfide bond formation protein DsbB
MSKRVWIVLLAIAAVLVLAACGGGNEEPAADAPAPAANEAAPSAQQEVAAAPQGDPAAGEATYNQICIACHGPGGTGVQGLGKPLTTSEFVAGMSDNEFHDFIVRGRDASDPANTTGVAMPPKGGNPALKDEDIYNVIAYVRQLQANAQ